MTSTADTPTELDRLGSPISLQLAGTYRRRVHASLERIWENVFDWEHLAHLHDDSFQACSLIDRGPWGWRVELTPYGAASQTIELQANRADNRYVSTTVEGAGVGTEIRVSLAPVAEHLVDVVVEFLLPETRPDRLAALGAAYTAAYARLWDEDEAMMQARENALSRQNRPDRSSGPLDLGDERAVRANLPLQFKLGGMTYRLLEIEESLVAHATLCPHWFGPLDETPEVDGAIRCPWHGYLFDVESGVCRSHSALKLAEAPQILLTEGRVTAQFA